MRYRVSLGAPLWDEGSWIETDGSEVTPLDERAAAALDGCDEAPAPVEDARELIFEHVGASWLRVTSPRAQLELTFASSLPRLWQRSHPAAGTYMLALEAANCSVLGRETDIAAGAMQFLDPGETRHSWLSIEVRSIA
jgi:hypothetical protein